jgi:hypothetical protein
LSGHIPRSARNASALTLPSLERWSAAQRFTTPMQRPTRSSTTRRQSEALRAQFL